MTWVLSLPGEFMNKHACYLSLVIFVVAIAACNLFTPQNTFHPTETAIIPTTEPTITSTPEMTPTPLVAENTVVPSPTEIQRPEITTTARHPCNQASLIEEVSIPNDTVLAINQGFVKIWHLKNTGSCVWNSDYEFVLASGDPMGSQDKQPLTSSVVRPGEMADVSVKLVAPAIAGTYRSAWKIRDPKGITFEPSDGTLDVEITTQLTPLPTVETQNLPDLYISQFTVWPAKPIKGQPAHVTIGVYNQGNADAPKFTVSWYGLSSFASPNCSWDVLDTISLGEGRTLECDFVFPNSYPFNKTSLVIVDPGNHVSESNEGNNEGIISPFGVLDH
jgi:hypothetical protein